MIFFKFLFNLSYITFISTGFVKNKAADGIVMHLDRLDAQCRGKNVTYQGYLQGVRTVSRKVIIRNCTLVSKESGSKEVLMTITVDRCRSKENLDTCENYLKQGNIDLCQAFDQDNFLSNRSPFYIPFVPPLKCPINKGIYRAYNITYDLTPFIVFKLDGWYWKVKAEVVSGEKHKLVFCIDMEGYTTNSKSKTN